VVIGFEENKGYFLWSHSCSKVALMPDFNYKSRFNCLNRQVNPSEEITTQDSDETMEQILESLNNTPIGKVLKKIASLPEIRKDKVMDVRQQLTDGKYNLNDRLDIALDKVLEDLTT
jgi:hypothetical protein